MLLSMEKDTTKNESNQNGTSICATCSLKDFEQSCSNLSASESPFRLLASLPLILLCEWDTTEDSKLSRIYI